MDLLARAVDADDVELAAIAIAALDREIDVERVRARLDALAAWVRARLSDREGPPRLRAFVRVFHRDLGFHAPEEYGEPDLHRIDRVLDRRAGSPVSLGVALLALGRRVGVELEPVAFPGHFLVRAVGSAPVLIEPCTGAMPIPEDALCRMAADELGLDRAAVEAKLARASARAVAVRVLENLERVHRDRGERGHALVAADRLSALGGPAASAQRVLATVLRALRIDRPLAPGRRFTVHRRGLFFRVDDEAPVDLRRRRALPLLLVRLAEHHRAEAGHGLGWPVLIDAGWPGEKIRADAAWARLRTAVRTLRKLGLHEVLITLGSGYSLDPSWEVIWD